MYNTIPYGKQNITEADIQAVTSALKSEYLTQGPFIKDFEMAFAKYVESRYAVAVSNGTAALHLSALALNVGPGDKVITTPITFCASANCVRYCGGEVVFSDIDPETYLLDLDKLEQLLANSPKGTYKGVIPVDFAGKAVDMMKVRKIADEYGLWIIEDACHAPGGYFTDAEGGEQKCGNGNFADLAIFSFHPVKHITTGEGGIITTNSEELYKKLLILRSHGILREPDKFINDSRTVGGDDDYPGWYMEMQLLGFNYRLTDSQAALGISQLARADEGIEVRHQIAKRYVNAFTGKSFIKRVQQHDQGNAYHLFVIEVDKRLGLYNYLKTKNILAQVHYIPVHMMPYYSASGWKEGDFPHAENYYKHCLSLPMYPTLTQEEQLYVIETICNFFND